MFDTGEFRRIIARFDERNVASRAVAEGLGFRQEARFVESKFFKDRWISTFIFAILRDEWTASEALRIKET
jgi:RimJ/RimL family protein N-acetyltransferase